MKKEFFQKMLNTVEHRPYVTTVTKDEQEIKTIAQIYESKNEGECPDPLRRRRLEHHVYHVSAGMPRYWRRATRCPECLPCKREDAPSQAL